MSVPSPAGIFWTARTSWFPPCCCPSVVCCSFSSAPAATAGAGRSSWLKPTRAPA
ncbi:secreted protein [gut metagenome]|uniref:Secreted protein n=1 Tax=gut metagenome TaxID=749906 RepID=J9G985_9ZZZZ